MSTSINTEVKGEPTEVRALASDLRRSAEPVLSRAADSLVCARRDAEDAWRSPAGEAFSSIVHQTILPTDGLAEFLRHAADGLDLLAGEVEEAQRQMEEVRLEAAGAGLTVTGQLIEHPGPPALDPGPLPADADSSAIAEHDRLTEAYDAQNRKIDAFTRAAGHVSEIRSKEANAASAWSNLVGDKQNRTLGFTAVGFGLDTAQGEAKLRGRKHLARAHELSGLAKTMRSARPSLTNLDERLALSRATRAIIGDAADAQKAWRSSTRLGQTMGRAGGALAVGGIAYDIPVLDRPWHQAVISGGAGFGASVAAGALVGTAFPVPVVGTAIGAAAGAAAGIYASGVVDDLFDGGGRGAFKAGLDTLKHDGDLLGNVALSTWKKLF